MEKGKRERIEEESIVENKGCYKKGEIEIVSKMRDEGMMKEDYKVRVNEV